MASIKKPKLRSLPKKPKAKASLESHVAYERKAKEIIADNSKKVADYNKKLSERSKIAKRKSDIVAGIGSLHSKVKSKLR